MSIARILLAAIAGGAGACLCAAAGWADHVTLNARPGLWEMAMSTQYSGTPAIPPDAAARLTPEQRAKVAASMAAAMAKTGAPHIFKSCVTEKTLQSGFDTGVQNTGGPCTRTIVSSSASAMDGREECTGGRVSMTGRFHFDAPNPSTINGTVNMNLGATTVTLKLSGKWVGADCGEYARKGE
jgi:hypothetical protein